MCFTNTYTALAIPGRVLTTGDTLVVIDKADGNKYEIKLTDAILDAWGAQLDGDKKIRVCRKCGDTL